MCTQPGEKEYTLDFRDVRIAKISTQRNMAMGVAVILMLVVTGNFFLSDISDKMLTRRTNTRKYGRKHGMDRRIIPSQYYSSVGQSATEANFVHSSNINNNAARRAPELKSSRLQGMTGSNPSSDILVGGQEGAQRQVQECDLSAAAQLECSQPAAFSWDCSALVDNDLSTRWAALPQPAKACLGSLLVPKVDHPTSVL